MMGQTTVKQAIKVSIRVTAITPITFTTSWDGITKIILVFSERLTTQFSSSDFDLSSGTVTSVRNFADSTTRHLTVSSVPVNTQITVEYVGNGVLNLGGSEKLQNGASNVTPTSPNPQPPTITAIGNVNVNEGSYKEVGVTARDGSNSDITLSLVSAPTWVSIDDNHNGNGEVEITVPREATSTSYSVTVRATNDNGYDTETFRININEINQAPILSGIGNKSIKETSNLSFSISASDSDRPSQTLRYSMSNSPTGSTINESTGLFSWTPNNSQVGTHTISFTVTDNGSPAYSDSQDVTFTITEILGMLVIVPLDDVTINEGDTSIVTVSTSGNSDNTITYTLINSPSWVTITGDTIVIPTTYYHAGDYTITVKATSGDDSSTVSFDVTVNDSHPVRYGPTSYPFATVDNNHSTLEVTEGESFIIKFQYSEAISERGWVCFGLTNSDGNEVRDNSQDIRLWNDDRQYSYDGIQWGGYGELYDVYYDTCKYIKPGDQMWLDIYTFVDDDTEGDETYYLKIIEDDSYPKFTPRTIPLIINES